MTLDFITSHRSSGVIIDTNVLLLFIVGSFDRSLVGRHKRTVQFVPEERYFQMLWMAASFKRRS